MIRVTRASIVTAAIAVLVLLVFGFTVSWSPSNYSYDRGATGVHLDHVVANVRAELDVFDDSKRGSPGSLSYDIPSQAARASASVVAYRCVPQAAGSGARLVANTAGDILDTTRITIPEGKFGYLLIGVS